MKRTLSVIAVASGFCWLAPLAVFAQGQSPIVNMVAQRVIEKYQTSSCAELAAKKLEPPSQAEERAVRLLHEDPAVRQAFIDRVAAPIANKLFECNMIP